MLSPLKTVHPQNDALQDIDFLRDGIHEAWNYIPQLNLQLFFFDLAFRIQPGPDG